MSSNRPPQLHLELPPSTTSFKRSFEQFGFDLESPLGGGGGENGGSGSDGNDRNKRARSASSFSDDEDSVGSSSSSTIASGSSSMSREARAPSALSSTRPATALPTPIFSLSVTRAPLDPPRLPTPELQDIDMTDYPLVGGREPEQQPLSNSTTAGGPLAPLQPEESYRLTLERFNAFDSQIAVLRRSPSPRLRSPTPPPVLPPLTLLEDQTQLTANAIPFFQSPPRPSSPPLGLLYDLGSSRPHSRTTHGEGSLNSPGPSSHQQRIQAESTSSTRDHVLNPISQESRAGAGASLPWFWPDARHEDDDDDDDDVVVEDDDEEQQDDVVFLRQPSPVPVIDELRTPSPLFEDLEDLEEELSQPDARRTVVPPVPPTLPPIQDTWDDPLDSLRAYSLEPPTGPSTSSDRVSQTGAAVVSENSAVATGRPPSVNSEHSVPRLASPVNRWVDTDFSPPMSSTFDVTFIHGPIESSTPPVPPLPLETPSNSNTGNDLARMTRLEALHGLREALQGIGRVLQESERSLRPPMFDGALSTTNNSTNDTGAPSTDRNYIGDAWRSGFSEGFASALSEINNVNTTDTGQSSSVPSSTASVVPASRLGLSEEYMQILRRDNEMESRPSVQNVEPPRDVERPSRMRAAEGRWQSLPFRGLSHPSVDPLIRHAGRTPPPISPISESTSSRPWTWESNPISEPPQRPSPYEPFPPIHSSTFTSARRPRLPNPYTFGDLGSSDLASNSAMGSEMSTRPTSSSIDTGLFGVRHINSTSPTVSSSRTSTEAPATLSRFRSRPLSIHTDTSGNTRPEPRPTTTESAFEARRRNARLEMMERRGRGPSTTQESSSGVRSLESHSRFSSPSSLGSRVLPEPRRASPVRFAYRRRERERESSGSLRPSSRHSHFDLTELMHDPYQDLSDIDVSMDVDREPHSAISTRPFIGSSVGSRVGHPRRESSGDSELPRPVFPRRRVPSLAGLRTSTTSFDTGDGTVDSLRQAHQNAGRTSSRAVGPDALREFLASPLPSPSLGEFDFAMFTESERPRRQSTTEATRSFSPGRTFFREMLTRRRSPSPASRAASTAISPRTLPRPPSPRRPTTTASRLTGGAIDPNAYAPGPFRNTMQSLFEAQVARENRTNSSSNQPQPPPVIPPLAFDNEFSTFYDGPHQDNNNASRRLRHESIPRRSHTMRFRPLAEEILWADSDEEVLPLPAPDRQSSGSRPPTRTREGVPESSRRLLNYLSGTPRFEESRLDTRTINREASDRDTDHAIELLRHDGPTLSRTQDIVNRFRRQREQHSALEPRNPTSTGTNPYRHWGDIEQSDASAQRRGEPSGEELPWARHEFFNYLGNSTRDTSSLVSAVQDSDRARLLASYRARRSRRGQDALLTSNPSELVRALGRRARALGDYVRDEDFDTSYEGLLSLAATIGEAKPRSTPSSVISKMETGLYKEWKTADSDQRCPICLDDYGPDDALMKLPDCTHWLHSECLQQWLQSASTCPVCRNAVQDPSRNNASNDAGPSRRRDDSHDGGWGGGFRRTGSSGGSGQWGSGDWVPPPWRFGQGG